MSFLPTAAQLDELRTESDNVIVAITTVLDFVDKWGASISLLKGVLPTVEVVDVALKDAKTFIDSL